MLGDFNFKVNPYSNILEFQDTETLGAMDSMIESGGGYGGGDHGGSWTNGNGGYGGGSYGGGSSSGSSSGSNSTSTGIAISPTNTLVSNPNVAAPVPIITAPRQVVENSDIELRRKRIAAMTRSTGEDERQTDFKPIQVGWWTNLPKPIAKILDNENARTAVYAGGCAVAVLLLLYFLRGKK